MTEGMIMMNMMVIIIMMVTTVCFFFLERKILVCITQQGSGWISNQLVFEFNLNFTSGSLYHWCHGATPPTFLHYAQISSEYIELAGAGLDMGDFQGSAQ